MGALVTIICAAIFFYKYRKREARKIELMEQQVKLLEEMNAILANMLEMQRKSNALGLARFDEELRRM